MMPTVKLEFNVNSVKLNRALLTSLRTRIESSYYTKNIRNIIT